MLIRGLLVETHERRFSSREGVLVAYMPMSAGYRGFGQGGPLRIKKLLSVWKLQVLAMVELWKNSWILAGAAALTTVVPGETVRSGMAH